MNSHTQDGIPAVPGPGRGGDEAQQSMDENLCDDFVQEMDKKFMPLPCPYLRRVYLYEPWSARDQHELGTALEFLNKAWSFTTS